MFFARSSICCPGPGGPLSHVAPTGPSPPGIRTPRLSGGLGPATALCCLCCLSRPSSPLRVVGGATEEELREGEALQANAFGLNGAAGAAPTVLPRPFVRVLGALQSVVGHFNECFSRLQQSALAFLGIGYMESEHRQGTRLLRPQHDARPVTQGLRCRANIMVVAYMRWQVAVEIREHLVRQVLRRVEVILDSLVSFGKSARKLLRNGGKRRPGFCIKTKV